VTTQSASWAPAFSASATGGPIISSSSRRATGRTLSHYSARRVDALSS
jgi:hypothetical protein